MGTVDVAVVPGPDKRRLLLEDSDGFLVTDLNRDMAHPDLWGYRGKVRIEDGSVYIGGKRVYPV